MRQKSKDFAVRIVRMYKFLTEQHKEFVLSKQTLRSGTSIGANIAEAFVAQSEADFIAKLHIARKEASETAYWLDLLHDTEYLNDEVFVSINTDCEELLKLLTSSIKTMKSKLNH